MSVSVRNVEKYFDDHPEFAGIKDKFMEGIKKENEASGGIISGGTIEKLFGVPLAAEFFQEVTTDPEHIKMGLEDLRQQSFKA